jgi:pimeloyl-ACP methyl ester carboxylesterase
LEVFDVRLALSLVLVAVAGCVIHVPMARDYRGPHALPPAIRAEVPADPPGPVLVQADRELRDRMRFDLRRVTLPSNVDPDASIDFDYYDFKGGVAVGDEGDGRVGADARTPVVVLLPIFNGQLSITRYFARYFAHQGWAAVVVVRERDPLAEMFDPEAAIRANLTEYSRVLDWVEQQSELDPGRIGVFGISLGAMDAVMLTALDDRVDALVAAMAGGNLASVMMSTNYRRIVRRVHGMLSDSGMSREGFAASLARQIVTDPLALAPYVDAERVLMIMTRTDAIVPFESQEALRESMGAPETLYLPTGHRSSIVYFPKVRSSAFEFFARQFRSSHSALASN